MRELPFKLKKDGKTVGFLSLTGVQYPYPDHKPTFFGVRFQSLDRENWSESVIEWDEIYQFVMKDKNGKDVFAEDLVLFCWMGKKSKAKIVKDDLFTHLISCKGEVRGLPRTLCKSDLSRIELIEETK